MIISGTDETSIDTQISSYNNLSDEAKNVISRIDTHTYSGSNREGLKKLHRMQERTCGCQKLTVLILQEPMQER